MNPLHNPENLKKNFYGFTKPLQTRKIAYEKWGSHPCSLFDWVTTHGFSPYQKKRFMEGGCGNGDFFSKWAEDSQVQHAIAVDQSPTMIENTKKITQKGDCFVADLHHLPFSDGSFDLSLSLCVFHHLHNPMKALNELKRVTKGGTVVVGWSEADLTLGIENLHYQILKELKIVNMSSTEDYPMKKLYNELKKVLGNEGNPHSIFQYINNLKFPSPKQTLDYYCSAMIFRDHLAHDEMTISIIKNRMMQLIKTNPETNFRKSMVNLYVYTA